MHGNRDFLLGKDFSSLTGMQIITDPSYEKMFNQPVLLMHGDLLCVDDVDYQEFRNTSRTPQWKDDFLSKSLSERKEIAQNLREISKQATGKKERRDYGCFSRGSNKSNKRTLCIITYPRAYTQT